MKKKSAKLWAQESLDFLRTCWVKRRMVFGILAAGILVSVLYALVHAKCVHIDQQL